MDLPLCFLQNPDMPHGVEIINASASILEAHAEFPDLPLFPRVPFNEGPDFACGGYSALLAKTYRNPMRQ